MTVGDAGIFKLCIILVLRKKEEEIWNRICLPCLNSKKDRYKIPKNIIPLILRNHSNFIKHLLPDPTDLFVKSFNRAYLNLDGFYGKAESCKNYAQGPFYLIREEKFEPRAALFFSLVCLGNFTYAQANAESHENRTRGKEYKTYRENVFVDGSEVMLLFTPTFNQGFSFDVLLKPFEPKVWLCFALISLLAMFFVGIILKYQLNWGYIESVIFSKVLFLSTIFDRPTAIPKKLENNTHFRILFGIWMMLLLILTNGYLGLSIKSISANLEAKSVTRFDQLAKPGCSNVTCQLDRLSNLWMYYLCMQRHFSALLNWKTRLITGILGELLFPSNPNLTLAVLTNRTIRKFDDSQDFTILPYELDYDISKDMVGENKFLTNLRDLNLGRSYYLYRQVKKFGAASVSQKLAMLDLLDPIHIALRNVGEFASSKIKIRTEVEIELALVTCGRTVLVQTDSEIRRELAYFDKQYPWIKFFRSEKSILKTLVGWSFSTTLKSVTYPIFQKLDKAGIVRLFENWSPRVNSRRENVTRIVHSMINRKEKDPVVKKVSLTGNIQTVFWLYLVLNMASVFAMVNYEVRVQVRLYYFFHTVITYIWEFVRNKILNKIC